jgi:predicted GTPase
MLIIPPIRIYRKVVGKLQRAYILLFRRRERVYAGVDYAKILDSAEKEANLEIVLVMTSKKSVTRIWRKSCRVFSAITDDET